MKSPTLIALGALLMSTSLSAAQTQYKEPPAAIRHVLDTPPTPGVSLDPSSRSMLLLHRIGLPPVADLAEPMLRLAGSRINPATNAPHAPRRLSGFTLKNVADGVERLITLPPDANLSSPSWSADGNRFVFTNTVANGVELWVGDVASAKVKKLTGPIVNAAAGPAVRWMPDQRSVLVRFVPAGRPPMPAAPKTPPGPNIQESTGTTAPVRTYQDLLQSAHDEALFDWVMTAQLAIVNLDSGERRDLGTPAIFSESNPSPNGEFLLIGRVNRPYSYAVPENLFPETWEIWSVTDGKVIHPLAQIPLRENIPTQGVETGPRGFDWIDTQPATLEWTEALDGGDPRNKAEHRDRLMMLAAPFKGEPVEWHRLQHRLSGMSWLEQAPGSTESRAMVSEFERERRWTRTWLITLGANAPAPRPVFDRSINDRYNNPGSPISERLANGRTVVKVADGSIYLRGEGATPEGDRPFLDRMNLADLAKERLWRNEGDCYETVVDVTSAGPAAKPAIITSRETKEQPPNLMLRNLAAGDSRPLTAFTDPLPELRKIRKEIITYTRDDGTPLSATMYLPPDYVAGTKLPLLIWAYPNEVSDAATAGQVAGSTIRFTQIGGTSHLFLLLAGYAVMDDASMPVIGDPETMNDTFVKQIVANARAAIDKAVAMGVADGTRVAVAGHSYGAFMTANLLAHAPPGMFRAGIARSGAYNRTLTPFGFQSERRSFWEARDVYMKLSPFTYADQIKTPLLMIHGELDNNPGTFPIQSERLFQAVKGQGGTVRLVMLPYESHGYQGRESVGHVLEEMIEWLDRYVKNPAN
ncbi:MAG: prolyl oligopeptidase family serine peptidase [Planctomycetes bacterium]|nr:prolyl oligopeptidase family serine peptidase [Planctomycetota bacterium]